MYEEVEINTPLELAKYLINEGDLYYGEDKKPLSMEFGEVFRLKFNSKEWDGGGSLEVGRKETSIKILRLYKRLEWYDCIPDGKKVPCYVSNAAPAVGSIVTAFVDGYEEGDSYPYKSGKVAWKYATPIPADELWVPEL